MNSIRETNGNFDSCKSCKRLGTSRLHDLHETKFPFVSLSNLSVRNFRIFLLMYPGSLSRVEAIGYVGSSPVALLVPSEPRPITSRPRGQLPMALRGGHPGSLGVIGGGGGGGQTAAVHHRGGGVTSSLSAPSPLIRKWSFTAAILAPARLGNGTLMAGMECQWGEWWEVVSRFAAVFGREM